MPAAGSGRSRGPGEASGGSQAAGEGFTPRLPASSRGPCPAPRRGGPLAARLGSCPACHPLRAGVPPSPSPQGRGPPFSSEPGCPVPSPPTPGRALLPLRAGSPLAPFSPWGQGLSPVRLSPPCRPRGPAEAPCISSPPAVGW